MCEVGMRAIARYGPGGPVFGFVIGHQGQNALVSPDDGSDVESIPCDRIRLVRKSQPKPIIVKPGGGIVPLSRNQPRVRSRRQYGAVQVQGAAALHARQTPEDRG